MQRRDFLKYSVALGVASALPLWSRAVFAAERIVIFSEDSEKK